MALTLDSLNAQASISQNNAMELTTRAGYATTALLVYDYLLTFSTERKHIWKAKKSLVFYLFVLLRYSALVKSLAQFIPLSAPTVACDPSTWLADAFDLTRVMAEFGIILLRVYAIWDRNKVVLFGLCAVSVTTVVLTTLSDIFAPFSSTEDTGGNTGQGQLIGRLTTCISLKGPASPIINTASDISLSVFHVTVLFLTVAKTARHVLDCRVFRMKQNLGYVLLRDGVLYFIAIEAWNIAAFIIDILIIRMSLQTPPPWSTALGVLGQTTTIILAQRLVLNLRQVDKECNNPTDVSTHVGELGFVHSSIIGNIGAPLRTVAEEEEDEINEYAQSGEAQYQRIEPDEMNIEEVRRDL